MARFILAFKKLLNLLKLTAPSQKEITSLADNESIAFAEEKDDGTVALNAITNDGEVIELATGKVIEM
jgi:hypothetical protein